MATESMQFRERYREVVLWPAWMQGLGVLALVAMLAALAIPATSGDKGWLFYAWYYPVMGLATLVTLTVVVNFRYLTTEVTDERARFRFGIFGTSLPLEAVRSCEVKRYRWLTYGGWGLRMASGGRMAYSVLGVPRGVEIKAERQGKVRRYFVSSARPEALAAALGC
jgi:hypothetical protein